MSYCTSADVQALNPKRTYGAATTPTLTQVQAFVNSIAGEIDTVLQGRGLTTPITLPAEFVTFLKQLNAVGAAAMSERAMFPEASGMMGGTSAASMHWRQYQDGLKFLKDGQLPSSLDSAESLPFSFFGDNRETEEEPEDTYEWQKRKFGKNKEF